MAVGGCLLIDGLAQLQVTDDAVGGQAEQLLYLFSYLAVAHAHVALAVGVNKHTHGFCLANGVAQLHQHLVAYAGGHHILGYMACGIGCRTVHLARVFARESAAAVRTLAAVGVYDYLATREARVTVRSANHEFARGVYEVFRFLGKETVYFGVVKFFQHARHENGFYILLNPFLHLLVCLLLTATALGGGDKLIVLRADHDGVHALGASIVAILHGHLTLRVGAQVLHFALLFAYGRQCLHNAVGQAQRQRHIILCFVGGVAEHHALVAGTLSLLGLAAHAAVDVLALLMHGIKYSAAVGVEAVLRLSIADAVDGFARHQWDVDIGVRTNFAGHNHLAGSHQRLACYVRLRVIGQQLVKHSIAYLVGHLVRMAFAYGFRSK